MNCPHPVPSLSLSETLGHMVPHVFFFLKSFEFTGNLRERYKMRLPSPTHSQCVFYNEGHSLTSSQCLHLDEEIGLTLHCHPVHRLAPSPPTVPTSPVEKSIYPGPLLAFSGHAPSWPSIQNVPRDLCDLPVLGTWANYLVGFL